MDAAGDPEFLVAIFTRRADAEMAVDELRAIGIADEHLGVAVHEPGRRIFEPDVDRDELHFAEKGALIGVPMGAIAGMGLMTLALSGVGTVAVGGMLAMGGASGALAGGFIGGFLGLAAGGHELEERYAWEEYPLQPGELLVVARAHRRANRVRRILERNRGRLVDIHVHTS